MCKCHRKIRTGGVSHNEVAPGCHDDIAVGVVVVAAAVVVVVDDVHDIDDVDFLAVSWHHESLALGSAFFENLM